MAIIWQRTHQHNSEYLWLIQWERHWLEKLPYRCFRFNTRIIIIRIPMAKIENRQWCLTTDPTDEIIWSPIDHSKQNKSQPSKSKIKPFVIEWLRQFFIESFSGEAKRID